MPILLANNTLKVMPFQLFANAGLFITGFLSGEHSYQIDFIDTDSSAQLVSGMTYSNLSHLSLRTRPIATHSLLNCRDPGKRLRSELVASIINPIL